MSCYSILPKILTLSRSNHPASARDFSCLQLTAKGKRAHCIGYIRNFAFNENTLKARSETNKTGKTLRVFGCRENKTLTNEITLRIRKIGGLTRRNTEGQMVKIVGNTVDF